MEKCSKCSTDSPFLVRYTDLQERWAFCHVCNSAFDDRASLLREFMKKDFGSFPVNEVQRDMIKSRMNRACGKGVWSV
jgi:hypothetical protein